MHIHKYNKRLFPFKPAFAASGKNNCPALCCSLFACRMSDVVSRIVHAITIVAINLLPIFILPKDFLFENYSCCFYLRNPFATWLLQSPLLFHICICMCVCMYVCVIRRHLKHAIILLIVTFACYKYVSRYICTFVHMFACCVCKFVSCMLANCYCQQTNLNFIVLLRKGEHLSGLKMLLNC